MKEILLTIVVFASFFSAFAKIDVKSNPSNESISVAILKMYFEDSCLTLQPDASDGQDAFVRDLAPSTNFGNSDEVTALAWTFSGSAMITHSMIGFDLSQIPLGAQISSASLYLYNNPIAQSTNGEHSQLSGPNNWEIYRVNGPWDEDLVTWNNKPSYDISTVVNVPASSSPNQDFTIDVSSLVQNMVNDPANSYGFLMKLATESYYRSIVLGSSNAIDPLIHPKLVVCYVTTASLSENMLSEVNIFPNPGSNTLFIDLKNGLNSGTIEMYTISGIKVLTQNFTSSGMLELATEHLADGCYMIQISSGDSIIYKRVEIAH